MFSIDPNDQETQDDIATLAAFRNGRHAFNQQIVAESRDIDSKIVAILQSDSVFQIAEFFYLLAAFGIDSVEKFDGLIERHNIYVTGLLQDKSKSDRMGLSKERLLGSIFDGETRPRVLEIWQQTPGTLDQSSIARFLVAVMSDETARKSLVACERAGYLARRNSLFRTVLVQSLGKMELVYAMCLRQSRIELTKHLSKKV